MGDAAAPLRWSARFYRPSETREVRIEVDATEPVAVSYTHLRAHETVLDLVCRLLLEKKKGKTTNAKHIPSDTQDAQT